MIAKESSQIGELKGLIPSTYTFEFCTIAKESSQIGELKVIRKIIGKCAIGSNRKREFSDRRIESYPYYWATCGTCDVYRKREFSDRRIESK